MSKKIKISIKPSIRQVSEHGNALHFSHRKIRNIVTPSGIGVRGHFPSYKASHGAQFESLIEEAALRVLEVASIIESIETQPCVLQLDGSPKTLHYTPDLRVTFNGKECFFEVKSDRFLSQVKTVARLRNVIDRINREDKRLYIILESDVREDRLQERLTHLLRERPAPRRYDADLDPSLWDPRCAHEPTTVILQRWQEAQRICDELLKRVMRRDPGELLSKI